MTLRTIGEEIRTPVVRRYPDPSPRLYSGVALFVLVITALSRFGYTSCCKAKLYQGWS